MIKNRSMYLIRLIYTCIASSMLVGCGTKGPLYIPEQRYPQAAKAMLDSAPHTNNQADAHIQLASQ